MITITNTFDIGGTSFVEFECRIGAGVGRWHSKPAVVGESYSIEFDCDEQRDGVEIRSSDANMFGVRRIPTDAYPYRMGVTCRIEQLLEDDANLLVLRVGVLGLWMVENNSDSEFSVGDWVEVLCNEVGLYNTGV